MQSETLVLLDFDGTITTNDSLETFFRFITPNKLKYYRIKYLDTLVYLISYKLGIIKLEKLKLKRINKYFLFYNNDEIKKKATFFSLHILPKYIKQSAINEIRMHKMNSHKIVVVSASLDILLNEFVRSNELELITNELIYDKINNIYFFNQPDCNFIEKVNRLKKKFDLARFKNIYAYGDSDGDLQMLNISNHKFFNYFK